MLPPLTTLDVKIGDDTVLWFEVQNDDDTPIDTTGWTAELSVNRNRRGGIGPYTYLSTDPDPRVVVLPGEVRVHITPAMSREWTTGRATLLQVEVTITDSAGLRLSIHDGEFDMRGEVRFEPGVGP